MKQLLLRLFYYSGLWRVIRRWNRHKIPILMYHGVSRSDLGTWTQVAEANFREQMEYVDKWYNVIPLSNAADSISLGLRSEYRLAVTFDDGFRNNVTVAYPILRQLRIPATIYLATEFINGLISHDGLLWTDYVYALLRSTTKKTVSLPVLDLHDLDISSPRSIAEAERYICGRLKRLPDEVRLAVLRSLAEQLGRVSEELRAAFGAMDWSDVRTLVSEGLISFGAHTANHVILAAVPVEVAAREIDDCRATIAAALDLETRHFAYPNGTRSDFNPRIKAMVATRFKDAVSTIEDLNDTSTDVYELRRIAVGSDMSMLEFKLQVSGVMFLLRRLGRRTR